MSCGKKNNFCSNKLFYTQPFAVTFRPDDIGGLLLWVDANEGVSTSGGAVTAWADQSGNGNDLTPPGGNEPTLTTDSDGKSLIRFDGINDYFMFASRLTTIRTIFLVIKEDSNASDAYRPILGDTLLYDFAREQLKPLFSAMYASPNITGGVTKYSSVEVDPTLGHGLPPTRKTIVQITTTGNVTADNFSIDRLIGFRVWDGDLYEMIIYDSVVSDSDSALMNTYLKNKWSLELSQICFEGDSFMDLDYLDVAYRDSLIANSCASGMYNQAVGGSGIGNSTSAAGNYMLETTRYNTLKARYKAGIINLVTIFEGINDLNFYLNDGLSIAAAVQQVYDNYLEFCQGLTALGFKVIINTLTPRNDGTTNVNYETARQNALDKQDITTINGLLRSKFDVSEGTRIFTSTDPDWEGVGLADVGDDPNFGQAGDTANPLWYLVDEVHPTPLMSTEMSDNYYIPLTQLYIQLN